MDFRNVHVSLPVFFLAQVAINSVGLTGFNAVCYFHDFVPFLRTAEYGTIAYTVWYGVFLSFPSGVLLDMYLKDSFGRHGLSPRGDTRPDPISDVLGKIGGLILLFFVIYLAALSSSFIAVDISARLFDDGQLLAASLRKLYLDRPLLSLVAIVCFVFGWNLGAQLRSQRPDAS